jgi:hypothetical protein
MQPLWSWRGDGTGMRLDYTLVSSSLASRVMEATILGSATADGEGSTRMFFGSDASFGSDHCPVLLKLREADGEAVPGEEAVVENGVAVKAAEEAEEEEEELSQDRGNDYDTE